MTRNSGADLQGLGLKRFGCGKWQKLHLKTGKHKANQTQLCRCTSLESFAPQLQAKFTSFRPMDLSCLIQIGSTNYYAFIFFDQCSYSGTPSMIFGEHPLMPQREHVCADRVRSAFEFVFACMCVCVCVCVWLSCRRLRILVPVVPNKAMAEVSKTGNLQERFVVVMHGCQSEPTIGQLGLWVFLSLSLSVSLCLLLSVSLSLSLCFLLSLSLFVSLSRSLSPSLCVSLCLSLSLSLSLSVSVSFSLCLSLSPSLPIPTLRGL